MVNKRRDYQNEFPSVTQVLDCLRKPGLEYWFKANTPEYIKAESERAKQIGTDTHTAIQSFIETGRASVDTQYAEEVTVALKSFMLFKQQNPDLKLMKSEIPLTSKKHKFNGTLDCTGENIVIDWKTARAKDEDKPKIWEEYKYQVAAYVYLYNENHGTKIDRAVIVSVAKDKVAFNLYVMGKKEINDCFKNVFLPALRICNFQRRKK